MCGTSLLQNEQDEVWKTIEKQGRLNGENMECTMHWFSHSVQSNQS